MALTTRFLARLCLLLAAPAALAAAGDFDRLQTEALSAYQQKDYVQMERLLRQAEPLRPGHPRALYNLAAARALQGDADGALAYLQRLDRMKLAYRFWEDPDFKALAEKPAFKTVADNFRRHLSAQGIAEFAFTAGVADFMPEGIAYDRDTGAYYLSSVRQRRVLRIDTQDQRVNIVDSGQNGMLAALGIKIEPRRRRLWVATSALPVMQDYDAQDDLGRAGLLVFDKDSGRLRGRYWLPRSSTPQVLGDLAIAGSGKVYTTDSAAGVLYELDPQTKKFTALTKPGELESPQGLTFAPGQRYLYLADYHRGLLRYDLQEKKLEALPGREDVCLYGIDGLYYYKGTLVAIQNGIRPNRVVRIELDESAPLTRVTGMQVLAANHSDFDEPTLGVLKKNGVFYFVANSHWNRVDARNRLPPEDSLTRPVVLRIDLDKRIAPVGAAPRADDAAAPSDDGSQR